MKQPVHYFFLLFLISACQPNDKTTRKGEPDIFNVETEDAEMNAAIDKSRETFGEFLKALTNQSSDQSSFSVKVPFKIPTGQEHIWLVDITQANGKIFGVVNNEPESATEISLGDQIEINPGTISDWF